MNSLILESFTRGEYSRGVELAEKNGLLPSNDPYSCQVVAACLFRLGRFKDTYKLLQQLESSLDNNVDFLSLYGATCRRLGYFEQGESLLSKALRIDPSSISIRNNYANLLIDLGRHANAKEILSDLLRDNPDFNDAKVNLARLNSLVTDSEAQNKTTLISSPSSDNVGKSSPTLIDPLAMAFAEEEVRLHGRMKSSKKGSSVLDKLPQSDENLVAIDKLRLAEQAVLEKNPELALQLLSESFSHLGAIPALYDCAADAYVQLKSYQMAEIMYLHAANLDKPTVKQLINLFTLSSIRGDFKLSEVYLQRVTAISPDHPQIPKMTDNLNGLKSKSSFFTFKD